MTKKMQIWKCKICGNIVEVLHEGSGALVCCGELMILMGENSVDASTEKHIPIIEGNIVKIGSVLHPMEDKHYIEWIEGVGKDGEVAKKFLTPKDSPVAKFSFEVMKARAYCSLHGLWK